MILIINKETLKLDRYVKIHTGVFVHLFQIEIKCTSNDNGIVNYFTELSSSTCSGMCLLKVFAFETFCVWK